MIYIFLDIDGVLCTEKEFSMKPDVYGMPYPFNKDCISALIEISSYMSVDVKWVLSSDWRLSFGLDGVNGFFKSCSIPIQLDDSCENSFIERGKLISKYIDRKVMPSDTVIIIDDIRLNKNIKKRRKGAIFTTDERAGLSDKKVVERIINYIKKYYGFKS